MPCPPDNHPPTSSFLAVIQFEALNLVQMGEVALLLYNWMTQIGFTKHLFRGKTPHLAHFTWHKNSLPKVYLQPNSLQTLSALCWVFWLFDRLATHKRCSFGFALEKHRLHIWSSNTVWQKALILGHEVNDCLKRIQWKNEKWMELFSSVQRVSFKAHHAMCRCFIHLHLSQLNHCSAPC